MKPSVVPASLGSAYRAWQPERFTILMYVNKKVSLWKKSKTRKTRKLTYPMLAT